MLTCIIHTFIASLYFFVSTVIKLASIISLPKINCEKNKKTNHYDTNNDGYDDDCPFCVGNS